MKLLLVEDDRKLNEALAHLLKESGYIVDTASDGVMGVELACTDVYDVIILDRMLPCLDGISVLKEIRGVGIGTPVLFLTARDSLEDKVEGLNAGADDYLVKPFFADELLARLRVLIRRKGRELVGDEIRAAGLTLDPLGGEVRQGEEIVQLTVKESALLELLMINVGKVVTKDRIMEKVWGYNSDIDLAGIDVYIHHLRKKLEISKIKTVRGVGYCLHEEKHV